VRERLIVRFNTTANALHKLAVEKVCAEFQSAAIHELMQSGILTEQETEVYKRGRNANGINPPRHSSVGEYRSATGLETLFGFLKLTDRTERIEELFSLIWEYGESRESK
jgi:ribonuclease-3 family protein